MKLLPTSLSLLLLAALTACTAAPPPQTARLQAELTAEIGDATCDNDAQCRTVAVGHKACGGPASYRAWSTQRSREAKVSDLARRVSEAEKAETERNGMMSNCAVVVDPGAYCKASRCELRPEKRGEQAR